jgi:hypothetical protein
VNHTSFRRWAIAVWAVPAIVIGLLGMHFMAAPTLDAMPSMSANAMDAHSAPAVMPGDEASSNDQMLMGMACILALLTSMLAAGMPSVRAWIISRPATVSQIVAAGARATLRAPSLTALSIRRT